MAAHEFSVVRLEASVTYVFAADNARARSLFTGNELAATFSRAFNMADFGVVPGNRPFWAARQGTLKFSDTRTLIISSIGGGAHEVSVSVEGSTEDATDALNEVWSKLGELVGEEPCAISDVPGAFVYNTTAVVIFPKSFRETLPMLGSVVDYAREALGTTLIQQPGVTLFRIEFPLTIGVGGLSVVRSIVIEPRFTAKDEDQVFFTASPLRSAQHVEMLKKTLGA